MLGVILGIYSLFIVIIWGLFILVRIHALKFRNFQTKLTKYLKILCFILAILSITGYIIIFFSIDNDSIEKIDIFTGSDTNQIKTNIDSRVYY